VEVEEAGPEVMAVAALAGATAADSTITAVEVGSIIKVAAVITMGAPIIMAAAIIMAIGIIMKVMVGMDGTAIAGMVLTIMEDGGGVPPVYF